MFELFMLLTQVCAPPLPFRETSLQRALPNTCRWLDLVRTPCLSLALQLTASL